MLCFLAAFLDNHRVLQVSSFQAKTDNKLLALGYIIQTLNSRDCVPMAVLLLEGSSYTDEEYDRMIETCDFPPNEMVYLAPELIAGYYTKKCNDALINRMMH